MEIAAALLCDAATVREGLLHVLGGGITRIWRPVLPAPLGVVLATVIDIDPSEVGPPHEIHVTVHDSTGRLLVELMGAVTANPNERFEPGEHTLLPVAFDMRGAGTPQFGKHALVLTMDAGKVSRQLDFWVLHPDEMVIPPVGSISAPA